VYAPSTAGDRASFWTQLHSFIASLPSPIILGGDFNAVLSPYDCVYSPHTPSPQFHPRMRASSGLDSIMHSLQLTDIWRHLNGPHALDFTHWSQRWSSGGRLDRFLISNSLMSSFTTRSEIWASSCIQTDHLPVYLSLQSSSPITL
jgi:exonuclease III